MDKLYQEGGLADDGTDIEPVTGNEVPTGSLDQEVRDDIPAQLSEGEYVVPADVVRYYGVKFFEDLRGQAKQDFARMEAEGRVGGEPVNSNGVPMEQNEELTPEEMKVLQEALGGAATGMAMGGMVPQQQQMQYNPYEQQQMQYSQPSLQPTFQTARAVGMQEGGDVVPGSTMFTSSRSSLNNSYTVPGSSLFEDSTQPEGFSIVYKPYVNETGQLLSVPFVDVDGDGEGDEVQEGFIIPEGYYLQGSAEASTSETSVRVGGDRGPDEGMPDTAEAKNPSDMSNAELSKAHSQLTGPGKAIGALVSGVPAVGMAFNAINNLRTKAIEKEMKAREMEVPETKSISDVVSDMFGFGDDDDAPSSQADDSIGSQGTSDPMGSPSRGRGTSSAPAGPAGAGGTGPGPSQGGAGGPSSVGRGGQTGGTGATAGGRGGDGSRGGGSSGGRGGQTGGTGATAGGAAGDGSRGGGGTSGGTSGAASGPAGGTGGSSAGASSDSDAGTPRAKGGLMGNPKGSQRKKPVKNKRKGLASK